MSYFPPKTIRDPLDLFLIFSNITLVPCIYLAYKRKEYIESFIFSVLTILSVLYHTCFSTSVCLLPPRMLLFLDSLFASTLLIVIAVIYACFIHVIDKQLRVILIMIAFLINGIFLALNDIQVIITQQMVILIYCIMIIIFSFIKLSLHKKDNQYYDGIYKKYKKKYNNAVIIIPKNTYDYYNNTLKHLNKWQFYIGLIIGFTGLFFYMTTDYLPRCYYWFLHLKKQPTWRRI